MLKIRKLICFILFIFPITTAIGNEETKYPCFDVGGSVRVRFEDWRNGDVVPPQNAWKYAINDDYILSHIRLHINTQFSDQSRLFVEGEKPSIHFSKFIKHRDYEQHPHFNQFYLKHDSDEYSYKIGRQTLDFGSRLVIGSNHFINNRLSFDLVRYDHKTEDVTISTFAGREAPERFRLRNEPHEPVGGYYVVKRGEMWELNQYSLYKRIRSYQNVGYIGARAKYTWGDFEGELDIIKQVGARRGFAAHGFLQWFFYPEHWSTPVLYFSFDVASGGAKMEDNYSPFSTAGRLERQATALAPYTNLKEYGLGIISHPWKDHPFNMRLLAFDLYKYDKQGGIYSGDSLVWGNTSKCSHLGNYLALLCDYNIEKTRTHLSMCLSTYLIGPAIEEFPNTADTRFFYLSMEQRF